MTNTGRSEARQIKGMMSTKPGSITEPFPTCLASGLRDEGAAELTQLDVRLMLSEGRLFRSQRVYAAALLFRSSTAKVRHTSA